jgi:surface polysaccharide O-acyltransferase-like enzyme
VLAHNVYNVGSLIVWKHNNAPKTQHQLKGESTSNACLLLIYISHIYICQAMASQENHEL